MVKVAINGFGRIGRNTLRAAIREGIFNDIDYVAINDPGLKPADAAHLFRYDSVMGKFDGQVEAYRSRLESKFQSMDLIISKMQDQYNSFLSGGYNLSNISGTNLL